MSASVLVLAWAQGPQLAPEVLEAAAAARALAARLNVPVIGGLMGPDCARAADRFGRCGLQRLFLAECAAADLYCADRAVTAALAILRCAAPSLILTPHGLDSAEWAPQLAAAANAAVVLDACALRVAGTEVCVRKAVCGGAFEAEYALRAALGVVTLAGGSAPADAPGEPCPIETLQPAGDPGRMAVLECIRDPSGAGPALKAARIVVAGGMGLQRRENWTLVSDAAAALGGAVGATRAAVESGWIASSQQVGYSGSKIAPELYLAIGISGAVHHLAGIAQARTVAAVNTDPHAEIFKVARFGVVGDAAAVIPAFIARVRELRGGGGPG